MKIDDAIKPLVESGLINEDVSQAINEAWENKLNETREQVRAELREEFAQRYDHDRGVLVESLDKMVTESLKTEISEFQQEKQALSEDRVKHQQKMREDATKFNDFMVSKLAEEIKEVRDERRIQLESQQKLEQFIVHALAREIKEFSQDKQAVVEAKVKLVAEGRKQLNVLKQRFITESAAKLNEAVTKQLKRELTQLKEDIKQAKENNFGRKLFEAYASEFSVSHLNEKAETRKLVQQLKAKDQKLSEAVKKLQTAMKVVENKDREVRVIKESFGREKTMTKLLSTLNKEKASVMKDLLESVSTDKLGIAFEKYLPAVLNSGVRSGKAVLSESVEITGDKNEKQTSTDSQDNVIDLKRLAGLK